MYYISWEIFYEIFIRSEFSRIHTPLLNFVKGYMISIEMIFTEQHFTEINKCEFFSSCDHLQITGWEQELLSSVFLYSQLFAQILSFSTHTLTEIYCVCNVGYTSLKPIMDPSCHGSKSKMTHACTTVNLQKERDIS